MTYAASLTAYVIKMFKLADGLKASIACINKTNELAALVMQMSDKKLEKVLSETGFRQKLFLDQHFPFDQMAVENQVRIIKR